MRYGGRAACAAMATVLVATGLAGGQDRYRVPVLEDWERSAQRAARSLSDSGVAPVPWEEPADDSVEQASFMQPPPSLQPSQPARQPVRRAPRSLQESNLRLASVPNMFGDLGLATATIVAGRDPNGQLGFSSEVDLPTSGGSRRVKIAENDSPIPVDRVFFNYNHFHNLFQLSERPPAPPGAPPTVRQVSIDRYTVGVEKTMAGGEYSVEVRLPFNGTFDEQLQTVGVDGRNIGNLALVFKSLLYSDEGLAIGAGLGLDTPTGGDTIGRIGQANIRFNNQALHVLPYIGFLVAPGDPTWGWNNGFFFSGFAQIDIATEGNSVNLLAPGAPAARSLGKFTEQNLAFLDLGLGYWLYRNPYAERLTGLSVITELHYTTALQNSDVLSLDLPAADIAIASSGNRFDVLNGTIGVQMLLFELSSLRIAGVFPLRSEDQRFFDSEVQVQFNRRF
jgi:hypothetical protein